MDSVAKAPEFYSGVSLPLINLLKQMPKAPEFGSGLICVFIRPPVAASVAMTAPDRILNLVE